MEESDEPTERDDTEDEATDDEGPGVQPLERTAPIYVEATNGYVDIRQPQGDPTLYTPEEARDVARDILAAADASERGDEERLDPHAGEP